MIICMIIFKFIVDMIKKENIKIIAKIKPHTKGKNIINTN